MKEEFLSNLRTEIKKELSGLQEYNERARLSQQRVKENSIKGFKLNDGSLLEKNKDQIIIETYKKHIGEINEEDTNKIYYYVGTFKDILEEIRDYDSSKIDEYYISYIGDDDYISKLVSRDDPEAEYRVYANIEGLYSYRLNLDDADEFEKTHIVIYDEKANKYQSSSWWRMCNITEDFVITSFKEGQKKAKSLILKKYNTNRQ